MKDPYRVKKKDLQRHAYLEEAGIRRRDCGTNFAREEKWMRDEQRKYGFDRRETYELGNTFAQWLYEHLRMYLDVSGRVVDLNWDRVQLEGETMSTREAAQHVLWPLEGYFRFRDCWSEEVDGERIAYELLTVAAHRWAEIAPAMWW